MNNWLSIIQDWFYPPLCLLCGDRGPAGQDLCEPCARALPYNTSACTRCALPLPDGAYPLCGACQKRPPPFDSAFALFRYEEPIGHLTRALKFGAHYPCARLLGSLMAEHLADRSELPEVILPVPLHAARYRKRGFNQAAEIARTLSHRLHLPLDLTSCVRVRATDAQAQLTARERRRNLRNAFAVRGEIRYRHIAVLDDVVTTGTTVRELAKTLQSVGVERVEVWAGARAPRQ